MKTTDSRPDHDSSTLLGLGSSDVLGPLLPPPCPNPDSRTTAALVAWAVAYAQKERAAERELIKNRLMSMNDAAAGRHNYYAHAAWVLFGRA